MSTLHNHILLYCKHWYGHSENRINDLKVLISKVCWIDVEHISDKDVMQILADMFSEYVTNPYEKNEALKEMLGWRFGREESNMLKDRMPEEVIMGHLSITKADAVRLEDKFNDIDFSNVNTEQPSNINT